MLPPTKGFCTKADAKASNQEVMTAFFKKKGRRGRPKKKATLATDPTPVLTKKRCVPKSFLPAKKKAKAPVGALASVIKR
jgi:hypothetical protein